MSSTKHHARICEPSPWIVRSLAGERRLDERADRAAADLPRAVDVERPHGDRRQPAARRGRRAPCARRRASTRRTSSAPRRRSRSSTTWPSSTLYACVPKTSLVEKSTSRSSVSRVATRRLEHVVGADHVDAHRAHRALEHRVDAGDRRAVDDVRRALRELARAPRRRARRPGGSVKFGCSASSVAESASRWRLSSAITSFCVDEPPRERRRDEARRRP